MMQYFGYLHRNPNDPSDTNFDGFNFWLNKLNQFNGNFDAARDGEGIHLIDRVPATLRTMN
jgi:hypothetical protein